VSTKVHSTAILNTREYLIQSPNLPAKQHCVIHLYPIVVGNSKKTVKEVMNGLQALDGAEPRLLYDLRCVNWAFEQPRGPQCLLC
jgi:hypothetical protein